MYRLVIFDWDGTIMDSAFKIATCIQASAKQVGLLEPSIEQAKSIIGLGLFEAMRRLYPNVSEAKIGELTETYKYYFVNVDNTEQRLFDGVVAGLEALERTGAVLAVATGKSRAGLDRVLDELGLRHHFIATRCADETRSKPHPQMLLELLDFTAIEPHKAIMVGDTTFDLDMAANAKVAGLGAAYGVHSKQQLFDSKALSVQSSFSKIIEWLLDGRLERAYE